MDIEYEKILHCELCNNTGLRLAKVDGNVEYVRCSCHNKRKSLIALHKSGLADSITNMRFDNFKQDHDYQRQMFDLCQRFIAQADSRFLYLSGQSGCGKTHLGTAVCTHFINSGADTIYATFKTVMIEFKSNVNDDLAYSEVLLRYGTVEVLYIDDFMKFPPSKADIDHAFELINLRMVGGKTTIITSERSLDEIIQIDEALGGRIKQMCGIFTVNIVRKDGRNFRTR